MTAFCSKPMFMSDLRETLLTAIGQKEAQDNRVFPGTPETACFRDKRLLLVQDNELNCEIALEILGEYGFRIDTAGNGAVSVEKIAASRPIQIHEVVRILQSVLNGNG